MFRWFLLVPGMLPPRFAASTCFPCVLCSPQTLDDLEQQQLAAAARRAREDAAAAAALPADQRATAAAMAKAAEKSAADERLKAVVTRLKHSQQRRRTSSQTDAPSVTADEAAGQASEQQKPAVPALPAVVVGIPVLPPPPPPPGAAPVQQAGAPVSKADASLLSTSAPASTGSEQQHFPALGAASVAQSAANAQPAAVAPNAVAPVSDNAQLDPLQQLIQQAEQLKAALERASGTRSVLSGSSTASSLLANLAGGKAAPPRLPNLLIPLMSAPATATKTASSSTKSADTAGEGSLSAATSALLAAARALRLEDAQAQQQPQQKQQPGAEAGQTFRGSASAAAAASTALDSSDAESDAEDALLDALLFSQRPQLQPVGEPLAPASLQPLGLPASTRNEQARAAAVSISSTPGTLVLRVWLQPLRLAACRSLGAASVRCVVKPVRGGQAQGVALPVDSGAVYSVAAECVEIAVAGAQPDGSAPALPPHLFLELWQHSGSLLGVVKVPLLAGTDGQAGAASRSVPFVVADGCFVVEDLLEGQRVGSMHVSAVLQVRAWQSRHCELCDALSTRFCVTSTTHHSHALFDCRNEGLRRSPRRCSTPSRSTSAARCACPAPRPMPARACGRPTAACCVTASQVKASCGLHPPAASQSSPYRSLVHD